MFLLLLLPVGVTTLFATDVAPVPYSTWVQGGPLRSSAGSWCSLSSDSSRRCSRSTERPWKSSERSSRRPLTQWPSGSNGWKLPGTSGTISLLVS